MGPCLGYRWRWGAELCPPRPMNHLIPYFIPNLIVQLHPYFNLDFVLYPSPTLIPSCPRHGLCWAPACRVGWDAGHRRCLRGELPCHPQPQQLGPFIPSHSPKPPLPLASIGKASSSSSSRSQGRLHVLGC